MELEHLFNGSALNAVDPKGRLSVPAFIRGVVERRSDAKAIVIGQHAVDSCLTAYDRGYGRHLQAEIERRRLIEEEQGGDVAAHFARARRTFGITEDVPYDTSGRIILPPMMRRKGQIDELARSSRTRSMSTAPSGPAATPRPCLIWVRECMRSIATRVPSARGVGSRMIAGGA